MLSSSPVSKTLSAGVAVWALLCLAFCSGCEASPCPPGTHCYTGRCNSTGCCSSGCSGGWWGACGCGAACPEHCYTGHCHQSSGCCSSGCNGGYWGECTCAQECPPQCYTGHCTQATGACSSGCNGGYWGTNCENTCPPNCYTHHCTQSSGVCSSGCVGGYWGQTCENTCPEHCYTGHCHQSDGCCSSGCSGGWTGKCTCAVSKACAYPAGQTCDWYESCLSEATSNCPFVLNIMYAKCKLYAEVEKTMTKQGQAWSVFVRACLQKQMGENLLLPADGKGVACAAATDMFLNDHLGCYVTNNPISYCSLSARVGVLLALQPARTRSPSPLPLSSLPPLGMGIIPTQ